MKRLNFNRMKDKDKRKALYKEMRTNSIDTIYTQRGHSILVDPELLDELCDYTWCSNPRGYASCSLRGDSVLHLQKHVLDTDSLVDHINGDPTDNRKINLRIASVWQNGCNKQHSKVGASGFRGVTSSRKANVWVAQLSHKGSCIL